MVYSMTPRPHMSAARPEYWVFDLIKKKKQKLVTSKVFVTGENTDFRNFISAFLYEYGPGPGSNLFC